MKNVMLLAAAGLAVLAIGPAMAGPIVNPDFSAGFSGWTGAEETDGNPPFPDFILNEPALDVSPHLNIVTAGAELANSFDAYELALFQTFDLSPTATTLSMTYSWNLTDSFDIVQGVIFPAAGSPFDPLAAEIFSNALDPSVSIGPTAVTVDVSALAGSAVTLEFFLQDGDFWESDILTVGNIIIAERQATVAEPPVAMLLVLGLVGFWLKKTAANKLTSKNS